MFEDGKIVSNVNFDILLLGDLYENKKKRNYIPYWCIIYIFI